MLAGSWEMLLADSLGTALSANSVSGTTLVSGSHMALVTSTKWKLINVPSL